MIEVNVVKKYVENMQQAKLEIIDNAGHHLFNTNARQLWDIVDDDLVVETK